MDLISFLSPAAMARVRASNQYATAIMGAGAAPDVAETHVQLAEQIGHKTGFPFAVVVTGVLTMAPTMPAKNWRERFEMAERATSVLLAAAKVAGASHGIGLAVVTEVGNSLRRGHVDRDCMRLLANYCPDVWREVGPPAEAFMKGGKPMEADELISILLGVFSPNPETPLLDFSWRLRQFIDALTRR